MKKIILVLLLIISCNVYAKNFYTDYEFLGYVDEKRENDEFYKYEEVLINNFYILKEANSEYLEINEENNKHIDYDDYKEEWFFNKRRVENENNVGSITIKGSDNYITVSMLISGISKNSILSIKSLEIYNQDKIMTYNAELTKDDNGQDAIKITFNNYTYVDNLRFILEYDNKSPIEFDLTIINESGLTRIVKHIILDDTVNKMTLNTLRYDKYADFINSHNLEDEDMVSYYYQIKKLYRHYDLIKDYYIMSELTELDSYIYDESESIKKYKMYKREKIHEEDSNNSDLKENDYYDNEEKQDDKKDNGGHNSTENVKYKWIPIVNNDNKNKDSELKSIENDMYEEYIKKIDSIDKKVDSIKNLTPISDCTNNDEDVNLVDILIIVILIGIFVYLLILHIMTVKYNKLNV